MAEAVSVRIPEHELNEIAKISNEEKSTKSSVLREILELGIKNKRIEMALKKYQNGEATAWKAAKLAETPLTHFLDILKQRNLVFNYDIEELRKDFQGI